ncbi:flavin-containing monooxygenase [Labrys okinawensis]|uniref:flavin-containing monooxygenase n=1 Tax=Labrys okinawensis TaxID=346911 RepID=UPI0039BD3F29
MDTPIPPDTSTLVGSSATAGVNARRFDVVIIGAGQAGLSVGHYLTSRGIDHIILDGASRIGDNWRARWDSLRLFSPAHFDGLPGMAFPKGKEHFPSKDQMADYLEAYAERFRLPVQLGTKVDRIYTGGDGYVVSAGPTLYQAAHVVVAMSGYREPKILAFAKQLSPAITQLHSSDYRNPSQLREGNVLIVGAGNSGSEIAMELATAGHRVILSGRDTGHVPFRIETALARHLLVRILFRLVFHRLLTVRTPLGRKVRPRIVAGGGPLIRVKPVDLHRAGVERVARTVGVLEGMPVLEGMRRLQVDNVVWCTGFKHDLSWIERPIFGDDGRPMHYRGVADGEPGLYFVGLPFLYAMSSAMIHGVGRDARYIADMIAARLKSRSA